MSKIYCECGGVIFDQSDMNRWKARFIPDQDYDDFMEVLDQPDSIEKRKVIHHVFHELFQCSECSALILLRNDNQEGVFFEPNDREAAKEILQSGYGSGWKGFMSANYYHEEGTISWTTNIESGYRRNLTLEELREFYAQKFEELSALDVLRSSFLRIEGTIEHEF
ncbi:MAG: hypothetical protein ACO1N0_10665 [Fluviicola sp.]